MGKTSAIVQFLASWSFFAASLSFFNFASFLEEWEAEKWEFPAKIDDAEFSPPRK